MQRQHLLYLATGLAVLTVAAFFYLHDAPSPRPAESGSPNSGTAAFKPADVATDAAISPSERSATGTFSAAPAIERHPSATAPVVPEKYTTGPKQPWEKEIVSLVNRLDVADLAKVEQLLTRISSLPPDGKVLAMDYATKLIPDEQYVQLRPRIFGLVSSPELRETVLLDVLTRGETIRMPTLVELLRQPANPEQAEVREILVAYLDKDYGSDVKQWESAVQQFLAENPDL